VIAPEDQLEGVEGRTAGAAGLRVNHECREHDRQPQTKIDEAQGMRMQIEDLTTENTRITEQLHQRDEMVAALMDPISERREPVTSARVEMEISQGNQSSPDQKAELEQCIADLETKNGKILQAFKEDRTAFEKRMLIDELTEADVRNQDTISKQ
jgi:hypothetical protein